MNARAASLTPAEFAEQDKTYHKLHGGHCDYWLGAMETSNDIGHAGFSLKECKQEFVSNLHGSTMLEIVALSALVPMFVLLCQLFELFLSTLKANYLNNGRDGKEYVNMLVKDVIFVGVPTIACLTVLVDWVYNVTAVALLMLVGITGLWRLNSQGGMEPTSQQSNKNSKLFVDNEGVEEIPKVDVEEVESLLQKLKVIVRVQ